MDDGHAQQPVEMVWNLESFYQTKSHWERNFKDLLTVGDDGWSEIQAFKGKLHGSSEEVKSLLEAYFAYSREIEKIYTYAHLRHDENVADDMGNTDYQRVMSLVHDFNSASSWIEPAILQLDATELNELCESEELVEYEFYLRKLVAQKDHVLSEEKEELLSLAQKALDTPTAAYGALNNADFVFPDVLDSEGNSHTLTTGSYALLMKSKDRTLRKNAFKTLHNQYENFENTISQLLSGGVQNHVFRQRARGYGSCLEAALKKNNIPIKVYKSLIATTRKHLDVHHRYIALRKKLLEVDELHYYDTMVPLVPDVDLKFTYPEACDIVIESVKPLGATYQTTLKKGLKEDYWVDVLESKGKRSGAYSGGCYDSMPYILLNYHGTLNDVSTLSHEAGHSMNSYMSNQEQTYHDAQYSIFVAEVASTFNEQLTFEDLLKKAKSKQERLFILNQQIDGMRGTFFRQVMFAELELKLHELAETNVPLTPALLKDIYGQLCKDYFGPDLVIDEELKSEYLRVPHFYYNFYVYQYATGIAAACALVDDVKKNGNEKYLKFLGAGGSDYPINILQQAGVDMTSSEPIETCIKTFEKLVDRFEKEIVENSGREVEFDAVS